MQNKEAVFCGAAEAMNAIVAKMGCPTVNIKEVEKVTRDIETFPVNTEINELKGNIDTLTKEISTLKGTINELEQKKVKIESDNPADKTELKITKAALEAANNELASAERANKELSGLVQKANQDAADARNRLVSLSNAGIQTNMPIQTTTSAIKPESPQLSTITEPGLQDAIDKLINTSIKILPAHITNGTLDRHIYYEQYGINLPKQIKENKKRQSEIAIRKQYNKSYPEDKKNNLKRISNLLLVLNNIYVDNQNNNVIKELLRFTLDKFIKRAPSSFTEAFPITKEDIFENTSFDIMNNLNKPTKFTMVDGKIRPEGGSLSTQKSTSGLAGPNIFDMMMNGGRRSRRARYRNPRKTRKQPSK